VRIAAAIIPPVSVLELKEEVSRLSKAERLQAMEWLWASLSKEQQDIESPEWHGEVLAARQSKTGSGEAQFLSVSQLKKRLRR
jgi:hypothetical protein